MARPKTKGEPIHFRLDIDADTELRKRAEAKGETPAEWTARVLNRHLAAPPAPVARPERPPIVPRPKAGKK